MPRANNRPKRKRTNPATMQRLPIRINLPSRPTSRIKPEGRNPRMIGDFPGGFTVQTLTVKTIQTIQTFQNVTQYQSVTQPTTSTTQNVSVTLPAKTALAVVNILGREFPCFGPLSHDDGHDSGHGGQYTDDAGPRHESCSGNPPGPHDNRDDRRAAPGLAAPFKSPKMKAASRKTASTSRTTITPVCKGPAAPRLRRRRRKTS